MAIVTEGLLGYLATDAMLALWRRIAAALARFPSGRYISDLHLGSVQTPVVRLFRQLLAGFVRGQVYLHFDGATEAEAALREAGFATPRCAARGRSSNCPNASSDRRRIYLRHQPLTRSVAHDQCHPVLRSRLPLGLLREPRAAG